MTDFAGRWIITPQIDQNGVLSESKRDRRDDTTAVYCPVVWPNDLREMTYPTAMFWRHNTPRSR